MEIVNQKTKAKCVLNFKSSGWFGKDLHKVEGYLYDSRLVNCLNIFVTDWSVLSLACVASRRRGAVTVT